MAQEHRIEIGKNTVRHHSIVPHWKLKVPAQKKTTAAGGAGCCAGHR
jgi:hypothetical protein